MYIHLHRIEISSKSQTPDGVELQLFTNSDIFVSLTLCSSWIRLWGKLDAWLAWFFTHKQDLHGHSLFPQFSPSRRVFVCVCVCVCWKQKKYRTETESGRRWHRCRGHSENLSNGLRSRAERKREKRLWGRHREWSGHEQSNGRNCQCTSSFHSRAANQRSNTDIYAQQTRRMLSSAWQAP